MGRVHHLSCGTMCPMGGRWVAGAPSARPGADPVLVCHVLAVETKGGLVLVDTGYGTEDCRSPRRLGYAIRLTAPVLREEETALRQLERLGFSARDVRHVAVTHLDVDHAGGLPDFPEATVHVMSKEHEAAMARRSFKERLRYRPAHFAHAPQWQVHDLQGERWKGFEAVRAVGDTDDEILLVPLEGHTRGHAGVAVRAGDGWLLHAGDAYFHELELREPAKAPIGLRLFAAVNAMDNPLRWRNLERLRELGRSDTGVRVFCAHDAAELRAFAAQ